LRLAEIGSPGLEPRRHLPPPFHLKDLEPFCVQRPDESVAFAKEQGAILPFQDDEAMLGLNHKALAEGLEVMNNGAGDPGIAWTSGDQTEQGNDKDSAPDTEREEHLDHLTSPRKLDESGPDRCGGKLAMIIAVAGGLCQYFAEVVLECSRVEIGSVSR
jgi:hypothetical protein